MNDINEAILISVLGSSPAVITETLYGLRTDPIFPSKLVIFTTLHGKYQFEKHSIKNQIERLCHDYDLSCDIVENIEIQVVERNGVELEDIRTAEDQESMADYITRSVRMLTCDPHVKVHASIAGGRKSMSFYMGYIFSMFARECDVLSHVLIDSTYEIGDFYYPTPYDKTVQRFNYTTNELEATELNAKDAEVELAEIPFIPLNTSLKSAKEAITLDESMSYRECIEAYALSQTPERIKLVLNNRTQQILINDREVKLPPYAHAYYCLIINRSKENGPFFKVPDLHEIDSEWLTLVAKNKSGYVIPKNELVIDHIEEILSDDPRLVTSFDDKGFDKILHNSLKHDISVALHRVHVGNTVKLCSVGIVKETDVDETSPLYRKNTKGGVVGLQLNPNQIFIEN